MTPLAVDTRAVYESVEAVYLPIAVAVFALVTGTIAWLSWRGRRLSPERGAMEAPRFELAYAAVLAAIVAVLVAVTFHAQGRVEGAKARPPATGAVRVDAVAAKWSWRFEYPDLGVRVASRPGAPATLTVPAGREVRFSAVSLDVTHGFWIPAMRFQREVFPGRPARFALTFPRPGFTENAACSFFCGLGHSDMRFAVHILAPAEFEAWARRARGRAAA